MSIFDLNFSFEEARVVIIPAPWDVTTSYGGGASRGPELIVKASSQIDHFSTDLPNLEQHKYHILSIPSEILEESKGLRLKAQKVFSGESQPEVITEINEASDRFNDWVKEKTQMIIAAQKIPIVLGGDHSVPYGAIHAIANEYKNEYALLHFDAHHDLRENYMGFTHSHASIMYNVMNSSCSPKRLVQVGIRDYCKEEFEFAMSRPEIKVYYDDDLNADLHSGYNWDSVCDKIIASTKKKNLYISFDIDGLDPKLCPNTGTPVPGGLDFAQVKTLFRKIKESGKRIIGADLVEVSPGNNENMDNEWDGNVGMRVLFELCKLATLTNK
ncbi:MAG: agmatinase family protein [Bdellovibrionales bacterium]